MTGQSFSSSALNFRDAGGAGVCAPWQRSPGWLTVLVVNLCVDLAFSGLGAPRAFGEPQILQNLTRPARSQFLLLTCVWILRFRARAPPGPSGTSKSSKISPVRLAHSSCC